jgi:hypothetical protein
MTNNLKFIMNEDSYYYKSSSYEGWLTSRADLVCMTSNLGVTRRILGVEYMYPNPDAIYTSDK